MTPASVQARQFAERRKGYDPQQVDEFLDEVTHTLNDLAGRLDAAASHVQRLEADLAQVTSERDQMSAVPTPDPAQVEALSSQIEALSVQAQDLSEQARVAEEARAAAASGYEEALSRSAALAEQIEAARAAHLRQQSTITALSSEVDYWKEQLEQERLNARPPVELDRAIEVLAAAQETAERIRQDAEGDRQRAREEADSEIADLRSQVNAEAARLRAEFSALADAEKSMRADVAALADSLLETLSGDSLVQVLEVPEFGEVRILAPETSQEADSPTDASSELVDSELEASGSGAPESVFGAWSAPAEDTPENGSDAEVVAVEVTPDPAPADTSSGFAAWGAPAEEVPVSDPVADTIVMEPLASAPDVSEGFGSWSAPEVQVADPEYVEPVQPEDVSLAAPDLGSWGTTAAPVDATSEAAPDLEVSSESDATWGAQPSEQDQGQAESDPYGFGR